MNFLVKEAILSQEKDRIIIFLKTFALNYEKNNNLSLYIEQDEEIIATVSAADYIIKDLAIAKAYQSKNLANYLLSCLFQKLAAKGIVYYQVYTKPEYKKMFLKLNFSEIITVSQTCLLETKNFSIRNELHKLKESYHINTCDNGVIVVNANPFTNGHLYLIEQAAKNHEKLIVFVLEEDQSYFRFSERFLLVQRGTAHLGNVVVVPSTKYIISSLTFPTYFLKEDVDQVREQAFVDAQIFVTYFMPIFNISKRYVGSEIDPVTAKYNVVLKQVLGSRLIQINRKEIAGQPISASLVRTYYQTREFMKIAPLVPPTTLAYLKEKHHE